MGQLFRTRFSRAIATLVVLIIAAVAIFKFQSIRKGRQTAAGKPTMLSAVAGKPSAAETIKTPAGSPAAGAQPKETPVQPKQDPVTPGPVPAPSPAPAPVIHPDPPVNVPLSADLLDSATKHVAAGDYVGARKGLNDALVSGALSPADADAVMKQIASINQVLVFSDRRFPKDDHGGIYMVERGDNLTKIAKQYSVPVELLLQVNKLKSGKDLKADQPLKVIQGPVCAVVTKGKFTIDLYLNAPGGAGSVYLASYMVGLGSNNSTPTGKWEVKVKVPDPPFDGTINNTHVSIKGGDPTNPIGKFWLALDGTDGDAVGKLSYGIHGTIDPASIGKQESQGCIRLKDDDIKQVYNLLVPKKSVVVVKD